LVADDEQGVALGTTQSLSSLGRVLGPALGGLLFGYSLFGSLPTRLPFLLSTFLLLISLVLIVLNFKKLPVAAHSKDLNKKKD
jgi:MFS transporter, DHA1 family, tetracycline resistance protein